MATRATRSARYAASSGSDSRCLLLALSHDALGVIFDGLADPLQPVVAVALSSTCLGLRTPLHAALEVLKGRHAKAVALCRKVGTSCVGMRDAEKLDWGCKCLTADDVATLGTLLHWTPRLEFLYLRQNSLGDAGMQALCEGLGCGAAPSLRSLDLIVNQFGPVGAEALATALGRGAMPKLEMLHLSVNPIGKQGVAALGAPLRKLPALKELCLTRCNIGDEGVAMLVDNLGKDDFKALEELWLAYNKITDAGMVKIVAAIDAGGLPKLIDHELFIRNNAATAAALQAVDGALAKRSQ